MNDFTKEELTRLYGMTKIFDGTGILPLREKIKSMIKNYCEHEKDYPRVKCEYCGGWTSSL